MDRRRAFIASELDQLGSKLLSALTVRSEASDCLFCCDRLIRTLGSMECSPDFSFTSERALHRTMFYAPACTHVLFGNSRGIVAFPFTPILLVAVPYDRLFSIFHARCERTLLSNCLRRVTQPLP